MKEILKNIKGRHWVFIIGFVVAGIMGFNNTKVAIEMLGLLFWIGAGIAIFR